MTILLPDVLVGSQTPRVLHRPAYTTEESGREAIDLAHSVGLHLDPWQQFAVLVKMAENGNRWAAREVGKLVARQNGKGASDEAVALHGLFLMGLPLQIWTAHQFKTSSEAFLRIRGWIDGSDDLRRKVKRITVANGDEGIELTSGARLRFIARSKSSGRGFSPQRIFFDEAQELATAAVTAMVPSASAQRNPQFLFTGTVPGEDNNAEYWTRIRNRGREGNSRNLAWMEWSPTNSQHGIESVELDSPHAWAEANPALGYRITIDTIEAEHESLDRMSFGAERLAIWPDHSTSTAIGVKEWRERTDATSKIAGPIAFALDIAPDRSTSVITAAGRREDGDTHVEVVRYGRGTAWALDELIRLHQTWGGSIVIDGLSPAASFVPLLQEAGIEPLITSSSDMARACGGLYDLVTEGGIWHLGDPVLERALVSAGTRPLAGGWAWDRKTGDIAPIVAATLAVYGVALFPKDPKDSQVHEWPTEAELKAWEDDDDPDDLDLA